MAAEVDALIGAGRADAQDFEALEQALRRQALGLAAQAMAQHFNADDSDHSDSTIACACGGRARYAGRRPKTFTTLLGPLTLHRAYYHCDACRSGSCPRDQALGLQRTALSPATTRLVGLTAAEVSRQERVVGGPGRGRCRDRQVHRRSAGRQVADDERAVCTGARAPMYLGLDGTGVPVRPAEVEGRRGKQPDGSAKTREVKLVTVWTAEGRDPHRGQLQRRGRERGQPRTRNRPPSPTASIAGATARFRHRSPTGRHRRRRRLDLWPPSSFPAPSKSSTSTTPQQRCGQGHLRRRDDLAHQWARPGELTAPALVRALRTQAETTPEARKCIRKRHRMRYPQFRARGLCISSGVVEAGCKQPPGKRAACVGPSPRQRHPRPALLHPHRFEDGSDEPQTPPDAHLTMMSCTPARPRGCAPPMRAIQCVDSLAARL